MASDQSVAERAWDVDAQPVVRLVCLFVIVVSLVAIVIGRLTYLQITIAENFEPSPEKLRVSYEPIATKDGRILGDFGTVVLARDVETYEISMHYRWLEEPVNPAWLRKQAWQRLSRRERRDQELVERTQQQILSRREKMWQELAKLVGVTANELKQSRAKVQARIERMRSTIERRRQQRERSLAPKFKFEDDESVWQSAKRLVTSELTTPPKRYRPDPLRLLEEEEYHTVLSGVDFAAVARIRTHAERFPGVYCELKTQREYPQGSLAAHAIGSRGRISDEELKRRQEKYGDADPWNYEAGDSIGRSGIERSYDQHLRGLRGLRKIYKNRSGEIVRTEVVREPRPGRDIEVAVNLEMQRRAETILDRVLKESEPLADGTVKPAPPGACLIALDVRNGEVIAAASAPRFDLNLMLDPEPDAWKKINADSRHPFFDRTTKMTLPPGSVFKLLTAVALLESGKVNPRVAMHCQGYLNHPESHRCYIYRHNGVGHGSVTLSDAICRSCNVYFYKAAQKMGPTPIGHWGEMFGFGQHTGADLPYERRGNLPRRESSDGTKRKNWAANDTLGLAIGQSRLLVTPMQIARMVAAIANDGHLVTPRFVSLVGSSASQTDALQSQPLSTSRRIPGISDDSLRQIRQAMRRVVDAGTGRRARISGLPIAGKTGTAETGSGRGDHAWFAGFAPANSPRVAFVVVVEHGGTGGTIAAPIAKEFLLEMLKLDLLQRPRVVKAD